MNFTGSLRVFNRKSVKTMCCFSSKSTKYIRKIKSRNFCPHIVNIQVLGSGASGSSASLYLFTNYSKYLFNCGEGTKRLADELKTNITCLKHIFMTRSSWESTCGLLEVCLQIKDSVSPNVTLHGPDGLEDVLCSMKRSANLNGLNVKAPICLDGVIYDDHALSIQAISFQKNVTDCADDELQNNSPSRTTAVDDTDYNYLERNNTKVSNSSPLTVELKKEMGKSHHGSTVISFICRVKPFTGAPNLQKCFDRGVPHSQLIELKYGNSIKLSDGTTVHTKDVCYASYPAQIFVLLDIPSVEFLESFQEKQHLFASHQGTATCDDDIASVVVHMSPQHVIDDPTYQNFMKKFAKSTTHLVLNEENKFSGFLNSHRTQIKLNQLNENIFPILGEYQNEKEFHSDIVSSRNCFKSDESIVTCSPNETQPICEYASTSTTYHLRPNKGLDRRNELAVCPEKYLSECVSVSGFVESLDGLKQQLSESYASEKLSRADQFPKILFLGTASATPTKYRNVSAILVHTTPTSSILLDCGEGTFGQLIRFYGKHKAKEVIRNLRAIYVSHLHSDHYMGLIGLLEERRRLLTDPSPIMLLAPQTISFFLDVNDKRIASIRNEYVLVPNEHLLEQPLNDERTAELGLNYIKTCLVRHCPHAFGIAFEVNADEPFKLTYSGDTIPCDELVRLGNNSTLLIHEATMEDDREQQARSKMHSTVSQAIEQGVKMNAKYTLLTHFSSRIKRIPKIEGYMNKNVGIAWDNMEVTSIDLKYLHVLFPTLKVLFYRHCKLMEAEEAKSEFD